MGWIDDREREARALVGKRVEIPVHYDLWMRGARFGEVVGMRWGLNGAGDRIVAGIRIRMDHPKVRRLVTVPTIDFDFVKVLAE